MVGSYCVREIIWELVQFQSVTGLSSIFSTIFGSNCSTRLPARPRFGAGAMFDPMLAIRDGASETRVPTGGTVWLFNAAVDKKSEHSGKEERYISLLSQTKIHPVKKAEQAG